MMASHAFISITMPWRNSKIAFILWEPFWIISLHWCSFQFQFHWKFEFQRSKRKIMEEKRRKRIRPCLKICQTVEERCPYLLPGDRSPGYNTQYAGEPTFLCNGKCFPFDIFLHLFWFVLLYNPIKCLCFQFKMNVPNGIASIVYLNCLFSPPPFTARIFRQLTYRSEYSRNWWPTGEIE